MNSDWQQLTLAEVMSMHPLAPGLTDGLNADDAQLLQEDYGQMLMQGLQLMAKQYGHVTAHERELMARAANRWLAELITTGEWRGVEH